jgi:hypothetical protein
VRRHTQWSKLGKARWKTGRSCRRKRRGELREKAAEIGLEHVEGGRQEADDEIGGGGTALEPVQLAPEAG